MRAKVVLSTLGGAIVVLALAIYIHFYLDNPLYKSAAKETAATPQSSHTEAKQPLAGTSISSNDAIIEHNTYVVEQRGKLSDLGMQNGPEALKSILSDLKNTDADIRKAAVTATMDFGSRDAIPGLKAALAATSDPEEKMDILNAIEFLGHSDVGSDEKSSVTQQGAEGSAPATN